MTKWGLIATFAASILLTGATASRADDWKIVSIQGEVLVNHNNHWNRLQTGDVVSDDSIIRSMPRGTALFTRDREKIVIAPNTEIQIVDRQGERYTTVMEHFGTVGVEANVENVKHFEVRTPYVAAVVKGTIFGVHSDSHGGAVSVQRGVVGVSSSRGDKHSDVRAGLSAEVGPDGALYIADDVRGTIWRVTYHGPADAALAEAPRAAIKSALTTGDPFSLGPPPVPAGSSVEEVALGQRIYFGEAKGGTCVGCHGSDGRGSAAGGSLTGPAYQWSDGSVSGLATTITAGVAHPKKASGGMPALGGAPLDAGDVHAVAAYVWTLGHHAG